MWTQNVVSTIMWRLNKSFMWIFSHITFLMSDVTYLNKDKVPLQIYLFIYLFFVRKKILILLIKVGEIRMSYIVNLWWSILHPHDKI